MNGGKDLKKNKLDWDYEEQEKFDQLYNAYSKLMYYIAFDVLKDEGLAQDAVQEAFINISKSFSKIKEKDCQELKGFIVVVIRRVAINMYNKRKRNNVVSFEELYEKGIYTVLATPTGARPAWMDEKYPSVRRVEKDGRRNHHSGRHNHCMSSLEYRSLVEKMDTKLAQEFGNHPGLIVWHISNEFGGEYYCENCKKRVQ